MTILDYIPRIIGNIALFGAGIALLEGSFFGIKYNVEKQAEKYFPIIEQNLILTKEAIKKNNYKEAKELTDKTEELWEDFALNCGIYQFFFEKGRKVDNIGFENRKIKKSLETLSELKKF